MSDAIARLIPDRALVALLLASLSVGGVGGAVLRGGDPVVVEIRQDRVQLDRIEARLVDLGDRLARLEGKQP